MKKSKSHILSSVLHASAILLMACSCNGPLADDSGAISDWMGYIFFDASLPTKASNLVTDMDGKGYGVIAFQYTSATRWETFKATGSPSSSRFPFPTEVDGAWTYDATQSYGSKLVPWENGSRYTFFAYYPFGGCMNPLSEKETAGVPVIQYTMPESSNPQDLVDVMRASVKDATSSIETGSVNFQFHHCLSCLIIEARNFDEAESASDLSKDQTISNLKLYFESDIYTVLDIPLDDSMPMVPSVPSAGKQFEITGSDPVTIKARIKDGDLTSVSVSGDNNVLMIPQEGNLRGYISYTDKNGSNRIGIQGVDGYTYDSQLAFESDKSFEPGKVYSIMINFTQDSVSIAIIQSGDWIDSDQNIIFQ